MRISFLISLVLALSFSGCIPLKSVSPQNDGEPAWLLDPYTAGDKIAAVGCAAKHFKGVEAQKKLAISRAIDQIATQNSVTVNNVTLRKREVNSMGGNSGMNSTSMQSVDNVNISTKVKALYTKDNGDICAWVVQR